MDPLKLLLVEDTHSMRRFMMTGLAKAIKDIDISEAQNGKEAQHKLLAEKFSCIVSDFDMPIMNGEELLRWVRTASEQRDIPFIMATATRERDLLSKIIKAGADACLLKPFTIDDLVHRLVDITGQANRRRHDRFAIEGTALFRYGKMSLKGRIIDVGKGGILGLFKLDKSIPAILENVSVDIETPRGFRVTGISSYIVRQQVEGELPEITDIKLAARFDNPPPAKIAELEQFFKSVFSY
jgi:two-component system, chemotaxis family, chemotaxis protein CheY